MSAKRTPVAGPRARPAEREGEQAEQPRASAATLAKRALKRAQEAEITNGAAALTYNLVMALVPSLLLVVSLLSLVVNDPATAFNKLTSFLGIDRTGDFGRSIQDLLNLVTQASGRTAGTIFALSTITALWSFSGLIANLMSSVNRVWELRETRSFLKRRLIALVMALATAVVAACGLAAIALGGGIAGRIVARTGLGSAWDPILRVAPFLVLLVVLTAYLAVVYWLAPNKEHRVFRWTSLGAAVATLLWILVTVAFVIYVLTFASYSKLYGPLAAVVIFVFWLYLSSLAILLGAAVDAEIERATPRGADDVPVQGLVPEANA